tara:strand:+ start:541 stop:1077 length:537 start_codon:yes stop_codon:yes gene_type:complete
MKKFNNIMLFCVVFTAVNLLLLQQWKIGYLNNQLELSIMRSDVNNDFTNELLWLRVNDTYEATKDQLVSQGRVEGVVSYLMGDDTEVLDNLWHEGYMRGLTQVDFEYDALSDSNYEKGYHAAMRDAFPHTESEFVNASPRDVEEDAIKTPEFDNLEGLDDNTEVIDQLNKKIEEIKSE